MQIERKNEWLKSFKGNKMPREINITKGYTAIVDDEDYEMLSRYSWQAVINNTGEMVYAKTAVKIGIKKWRHKKMHQFLIAPKDGMVIDHINRNALDNRKCNLRLASRAQNSQNAPGWSKTGFRGVTKSSKKTERYYAVICVNYKRIHVGSYKTAVEAARAYDQKAKEIYGDHAYLNFNDLASSR